MTDDVEVCEAADDDSDHLCTYERYTKIECWCKRNDRWMNTHVSCMLEAWMANCDVRLVVDIGKVIQYLTKYVTKPEKDMSVGMCHLIKTILHTSLNVGVSVKSTLRKIMSKLIGSRVMSKQETCHLINSMSLVSCLHNFRNINLVPKSNRLDMVDAGDVGIGDVSVKSIVFMYGRRFIPSLYAEQFPLIGYWNVTLDKLGLNMSDI